VKKYTQSAKKSENKQNWWVVDAEGQVLGRLATTIAARLRGKHNPAFTPHVDTGDAVVVINAGKIVLTGKKLQKKIYYRHSGYIGGLTEITAEKLLEKRPEDLIRHAVKGMLPKTSWAGSFLKNLKFMRAIPIRIRPRRPRLWQTKLSAVFKPATIEEFNGQSEHFLRYRQKKIRHRQDMADTGQRSDYG